ncbi:hypothetical protein QN277_002897 [Acacia crassicarpa]|uniref:Uncharacterized protein n=1 Tax=Acacia crassicarpa TaxID=499986 RepID=A0AAE1NAG6_9FABA|nr:hypothetical protein QN277_002897 [Acacia crassicarpa]
MLLPFSQIIPFPVLTLLPNLSSLLLSAFRDSAVFPLSLRVRGLGLKRIVRGMQRSLCEELNALGWKKSFRRGIGITAPKARTRNKLMC